jgi:hypothetical protein
MTEGGLAHRLAGPVGPHNLTLRVNEAALRSDVRLDWVEGFVIIGVSETITAEEKGMDRMWFLIYVGSDKLATGVDAIEAGGYYCTGKVDLRVHTPPQDEAVGVAPVIIEVSHYRVGTIAVDRRSWASRVFRWATEGHVYSIKREFDICLRKSGNSNEQAYYQQPKFSLYLPASHFILPLATLAQKISFAQVSLRMSYVCSASARETGLSQCNALLMVACCLLLPILSKGVLGSYIDLKSVRGQLSRIFGNYHA